MLQLSKNEKRNQELVFWKRKGKKVKDIYVRLDRGVGQMQQKINMQCFPLYSILKAIGKTKFDYLSLDVEGSEYGIIHSAFKYNNDFKLEMASVETTYLNGITGFSMLELNYLMKKEGYILHKHIGEDDMFIRKNLSIACC